MVNWDSSGQIVLVVEVLNMFKNESSCTLMLPAHIHDVTYDHI